MATPEALLRRLEALKPRHARLLSVRFLEGRSLQQTAGWLGTTPAAADTLLQRALAELAGLPEPRSLRAAPELDPLARELADAGPAMQALLRERERLEAESPRARRAGWVRRALFAAVLLGTVLALWSRR